MKKLILISCLALAAAGCVREGGNNNQEADNLAAEGGADLNAAIGGDELSPIPEAEDDMIANDSGATKEAATRNRSQPVPIPAPAPR